MSAGGTDQQVALVGFQALLELGLGGDQGAVEIDLEAVTAERDGEVVGLAGTDIGVLDVEGLGRVVGLLADDDLAVLDPGGEVTAVLIAAAVLGEQAALAGDVVGGEGQRDGALVQRQSRRMVNLNGIALGPGQHRRPRHPKHRRLATGKRKTIRHNRHSSSLYAVLETRPRNRLGALRS